MDQFIHGLCSGVFFVFVLTGNTLLDRYLSRDDIWGESGAEKY